MMLVALAVFVLVAGTIIGVYYAATSLPGYLAARRLDQRLHDVSFGAGEIDPKDDSTVVKHTLQGPLPAMDRASTLPPGSGSRAVSHKYAPRCSRR